MDVLKYYVPLVQLGKQQNIPIDIIRNMFNDYLKSNIIIDIQSNVISREIEKKYNNYLYNNINNKKIYMENCMSLHLCDIPYSCEDMHKYSDIINHIIEKNNYNLHFSHYCCSNKGVMYTFNDRSNRNHRFLLS